MKVSNALIWAVALLGIVFVILNWSLLGAPTLVSFGFTHVQLPLGLLLLGLAVALSVVCFGVLLTAQLRLLAMHRRHDAELRAQRALAGNAEASRITELQRCLLQELSSLKEASRLSELHLREELQATSNALSACIGVIDERLERHFPAAPERQP
jgi:uncharacterized integral membrane protein